MKFLKISLLVLVIGIVFGCSAPADAEIGPDTVTLTVGTSRTFVPVQDHLATTTPKKMYVLSLDDDIEVVAWRYLGAVWTRVIPNPYEALSDSVITCPTGFTLPVFGQFDALTLRGTVSGGSVLLQWYK